NQTVAVTQTAEVQSASSVSTSRVVNVSSSADFKAADQKHLDEMKKEQDEMKKKMADFDAMQKKLAEFEQMKAEMAELKKQSDGNSSLMAVSRERVTNKQTLSVSSDGSVLPSDATSASASASAVDANAFLELQKQVGLCLFLCKFIVLFR